MRDLPAGRVTFLFTDIEGSTRLLHALGDRYAEVLADHRRLLRAAFARHGGVEVDTQGDSFFVAFADAGDALAAAEESQRALIGTTWPEGPALKVRMGLHTGEPLVADGHYVGIDVHRAARIAAAAHGGQVIVSERTTALLGEDGSPPTLRDLGAHHLKDLPEPERLFQLLAVGLPSSFPPPRVHEEAIEAAGLPDYSLPPADVPCPYKGLLPFEPEDSELFYGRERLVEDVAARLTASGFLAVVGPSGSGKSSLVRAGVVPALQHAADGDLDTAIFTPGAHPLAQLDGELDASLLVVDQFEEVFTLCRDEEKRATFIEALLDRAESGGRVIVALRADFYGHCATYPRLAAALEQRQALVGPMSEEELRRAIERPGEHAGLVLEPGVVEAILRDVAGQPGALPLMSHSLLETWKRRSGRMLTVIGYLQSGGVHGAIAKTAETVYRDTLSPDEQRLARNIFLRLTELGEGTEDTRRRVSTSELIPSPEQEAEVREVVRTLADARLVTTGEGTVEVAHEALIRHWPTLREWLDEDREGRLLHRRLTEAAQEWDALDRDPGVLFRGTRLATTGDWATAHDPELNELEREFLTASRQASQAEAERQRRANRRLRGLLIGAVTLLALAVVAGGVALVQRSHAQHAQAVAEGQALTADAKRLGILAGTETNLDRKLLLAVAGVQLENLPETRGDLLGVLQDFPAAFRLIRPSRVQIRALAASPDARLLASADSFGVVRFHDLRTWKPSGAPVRVDGPVSQQAAAFSPDGRRMAVGTVAENRVSVDVIDVGSRTTKRIGSWPSVPAAAGPLRFIRLGFSPDGRRIAVAVATATPRSPVPVGQRLLLLETGSGRIVWQRTYPLSPGQNEAQVEFAGPGALVTSAQQGDTLLWNATTGRIERRFRVGGPFAVSPDGLLAAVAQNSPNPADPSASLAVLDLRTGRHRSLEALPARAWIIGLQFTPDAKRVVGASFDGALRVWDFASGSIEQTFTGQGSGLNLAVLADGSGVVYGSQSGAVTAWDITGAQRLGPTLRWNSPDMGCSSVPCLAVNRQSTLMSTNQADGTVAIIDLRTHEVVSTLPARNGPDADALAFFPDGRTLATGGVNGHVTLWDVTTRSVERTLRFPDPVVWTAVSPDGRLLAVQTQARGKPGSRVEVRDLSSRAVLYGHRLPSGADRGGLSFSPDGRKLAALGCCERGSLIKVWAARSGTELYEHRGLATVIAFSPDGRLLGAGTTDGKLVLLNARDGRQVATPIRVATETLETISFSPDGRQFAATSADLTTTLWDLRSRKRLGNSFPVRQEALPVAQFTPKGDLLIVYLADAAQWPTDMRTWKRFACQVAGRDLTRAEWADLLPNRPYQPLCPH
jgi:class 3 adenylate cyclase/WD40 repeat protein/energy-coupling factor transporter ATP-binding protein EcfA2